MDAFRLLEQAITSCDPKVLVSYRVDTRKDSAVRTPRIKIENEFLTSTGDLVAHLKGTYNINVYLSRRIVSHIHCIGVFIRKVLVARGLIVQW